MTLEAREIQLIIVDLIAELCAELAQRFAGIDSVAIENDRFENILHYDCMVSAGNSFGLMDGGVDLAIINYFGIDLMDRVQQHILREFRGEQPVGTSFIIETKHPQHPFLAHTPTMKVPMAISQTDNVYRAMYSMLLAVWQHNKKASKQIKTVVCPGLGTMTGQMPFDRAAKHMALAYKNFVHPFDRINWAYAITRQNAIDSGGDN